MLTQSHFIQLDPFPIREGLLTNKQVQVDGMSTVCGKDLDSLIHHIYPELPKMYHWLCVNKLTLNLTKTKYIIFQPRQKLNSNLHLPIVLAGQLRDHSSSVKY